MNAVPFDTLKMAKRLEAAGFAVSQAAGAAEALVGAELATRTDMTGVKTEAAALGTEMKGDIAALRTELNGDIGSLRAEALAAMELPRRDMTIELGGMMFVAVGVLLAAIRYLPPHP